MRAEEVEAGLAGMDCPVVADDAWVTGSPLAERRVALVSTAGLAHRGDPPFGLGAADYRVIDSESSVPLQMSHISTNFDRTGFAQDLNVVWPLELLDELRDERAIGSVAKLHYSFMGATPPERLDVAVPEMVAAMQADQVDLALLIPV